MTAPPPDAPARPPELDEVTLARAQRGDEPACRALVERYQRPVFALLSRMLAPRGARAAVEDLAQETFLRVFRALPAFDRAGPARLSTWILTIATRLAIDFQRRAPPPTEPLELHRDLLHAAPPAAPGLGAALQRAVLELPPDFRAAFLLREAHGLSYEEIAQALALDLGTVKSRISRARAALRALLEDEHE